MTTILIHLVQQPLVIALLIFCAYVGIRYTQKIVNGRTLALTLFLSVLTLFINSFPIALGYGQSSFLPNRIYFLLDTTALAGMIITSICLGMYVKSQPRYKEVGNNVCIELIMAGSVSLLLYSTVVYNQNINDLPWFKTLHNVREVKGVHDSWIECLVAIRDAEEDRVEIEMNQEAYSSPILLVPSILDQEEFWVNAAVAEYFGKESVVVRIREE